MNKSERINDMMLFLNDRSSFNLKDIMKKYNISRSTALRDISSLEEIGMPIYSQTGRNGFPINYFLPLYLILMKYFPSIFRCLL